MLLLLFSLLVFHIASNPFLLDELFKFSVRTKDLVSKTGNWCFVSLEGSG